MRYRVNLSVEHRAGKRTDFATNKVKSSAALKRHNVVEALDFRTIILLLIHILFDLSTSHEEREGEHAANLVRVSDC